MQISIDTLTHIATTLLGGALAYVFTELKALARRYQALATDMADYKVHIAETYVTATDLREVEKRITTHLERIEDKIDRKEGLTRA